MADRAAALERLLRDRIVILDGAIGTLIQRRNLDEASYRGERFAAHARDLRGNFDVLNLTRPDLIADLHRAYLAAGADIIRTNTFGSTSVSQAVYGIQDRIGELNREGAAIARRAADAASAADPSRPRFVAGTIGPTKGQAAATLDELIRCYGEAAAALLEGGADFLMMETVFDKVNVDAALRAVRSLEQERGTRIALMVSGTPMERDGRMLSGETPEEFWQSVSHARPIAVGLNCGFGARPLQTQLSRLARAATAAVSVYPSAGLPNGEGDYDDSPANMADALHSFAEAGLVNIVGGCCGTTPDFIAAIAEAVQGIPPRKFLSQPYP